MRRPRLQRPVCRCAASLRGPPDRECLAHPLRWVSY